jgi:hypothetical protein
MRDFPRGGRLLPLLRAPVRDACKFLVQGGVAQQSKAAYAVSPHGVADSTAGQVSLTGPGAHLLASGQIEWWTRDQVATSTEARPADPETDQSFRRAMWEFEQDDWDQGPGRPSSRG